MPPKKQIPEASIRGDVTYGETSLRRALETQVKVRQCTAQHKCPSTDSFSRRDLCASCCPCPTLTPQVKLDGADWVSPSDLVNGRQGSKRAALDIGDQGFRPTWSVFRHGNGRYYYRPTESQLTWIAKVVLMADVEQMSDGGHCYEADSAVNDHANELPLNTGLQSWFTNGVNSTADPARKPETLPFHILQEWVQPEDDQVFTRYLGISRR